MKPSPRMPARRCFRCEALPCGHSAGCRTRGGSPRGGRAFGLGAIPPSFVGWDLVGFLDLLIVVIHDSMHEGSLDDVADWLWGHLRKLLAGLAARHCPPCRFDKMRKDQLARFLAEHFAEVVIEKVSGCGNAPPA